MCRTATGTQGQSLRAVLRNVDPRPGLRNTMHRANQCKTQRPIYIYLSPWLIYWTGRKSIVRRCLVALSWLYILVVVNRSADIGGAPFGFESPKRPCRGSIRRDVCMQAGAQRRTPLHPMHPPPREAFPSANLHTSQRAAGRGARSSPLRVIHRLRSSSGLHTKMLTEQRSFGDEN